MKKIIIIMILGICSLGYGAMEIIDDSKYEGGNELIEIIISGWIIEENDDYITYKNKMLTNALYDRATSVWYTYDKKKKAFIMTIRPSILSKIEMKAEIESRGLADIEFIEKNDSNHKVIMNGFVKKPTKDIFYNLIYIRWDDASLKKAIDIMEYITNFDVIVKGEDVQGNKWDIKYILENPNNKVLDKIKYETAMEIKNKH